MNSENICQEKSGENNWLPVEMFLISDIFEAEVNIIIETRKSTLKF